MAVLTVKVTHHPHHSVLSLCGELDVTSVATMKPAVESVIESGRRHLVMDAAKLSFCDSYGLWGLLDAQRDMVEAGGTMELTHVQGVLRRVLDLTGLARAFTITGPEVNSRRGRRIAGSIRVTPWA